MVGRKRPALVPEEMSFHLLGQRGQPVALEQHLVARAHPELTIGPLIGCPDPSCLPFIPLRAQKRRSTSALTDFALLPAHHLEIGRACLAILLLAGGLGRDLGRHLDGLANIRDRRPVDEAPALLVPANVGRLAPPPRES